MPKLTWPEIEATRARRWGAVLLHLTDRCPVGCAHCSVDSRPDSPAITDFPLFEQVLDGVCAVESFDIVGVSGGEPFIERRALAIAAERISDTGKQLVVYTSGLWGGAAAPPDWIRLVLSRTACLVLSGDAFHFGRMAEDRFIGAARAAERAGCWIVCQVIDTPRQRAGAAERLVKALGSDWRNAAEIRPTPLLPFGRAARLVGSAPGMPGALFGRCSVVDTPVVRYDGWVLGCCNENVVTGAGPAALRRRVTSSAEVVEALAALRRDRLLTAFGQAGLGAVATRRGHHDLAERPAARICDLCWDILDREAPSSAVVEPIREVVDEGGQRTHRV